MKKIAILFFVLLLTGQMYAQETSSYYVVIGAFRNIDYAIAYTNKANKAGFSAEYAFNKDRQLNYVFVLSTNEKRKAFSFMMKIRLETEYTQAWVFTGKLGADQPQESLPIEESPIEEKPEPVLIEEKPKVDSTALKPEPLPVVEEPQKPQYRPFVFRLTDSETKKEIKGDIFLQENISDNNFSTYVTSENVMVDPPKNVAGSYVLFTQAAGYQNVTQNINFKTLQGTSKNLNEPVVISISLKQVKKGDYIEFTHVRFFKDASILQPGSEDELRGLADLMKENARYKIKIHAHCNGKADREATLMGTSTQYFATASGNEKKTVSAKQLTAARAEAVKNYLISQGVEGSRIGTMAEGGRIPLYPETGNTSQFNDRVEIEVVRR